VVEHFLPEHRAIVLAEMERVAGKYIVVTTPFTEKLVNGFRTHSRGRLHVNRHFDSFDVATVAGFFQNFTMTNCVLSGDEWDDELGPISYMKRARIRATEGGLYGADAVAAIDAVIEEMRMKQAAYLSANPQAVDTLKRRTEIIAFFERTG